MAEYVRLLGRLVHNLATRVGEDLADCAAFCRRGLVYKLRSFRSRYDDVGPGGVQDFQLPPEQLASLVESVHNKPWFCELDRRAAQHLVHSGGSGCFVVRPSASTRSLTLTLWFHHRAFNILIRQREDGRLALGSKKTQEVTFQSVDEMVRHYERELLILYSGGELAGRTRLRAPPPGLVGGRASITSSDGIRRSSDGTELCHRNSRPQTLSSGNCQVSSSSRTTQRLSPSSVQDCAKVQESCGSGGHLIHNEFPAETPLSLPSKQENSPDLSPVNSNAVHVLSPSMLIPGRAVPTLSLSVVTDHNDCDSTCL